MRGDAAFYRSLAHLHGAGIPWPQAVVSAAGSDLRLAAARGPLERGVPLSEALEGIVDPLDAALLRAGERDGTLQRTLLAIASAHEEALRRHRGGSLGLVYPILLAHVAAVLMLLPEVVVGRPLQGLTWSILVLLPVYGVLGLRWIARSMQRPRPEGGEPPEPPAVLLGPLRNRVEEADARALEALGRLHDGGVPLDEALDLAVQAGWGGRAARDLWAARRRVASGEDVSGALTRLPEAFVDQVKSAEASGTLGEALRQIAGYLRFEVDLRRQRATAVLPTALLLLVGLVIAWRVLSFYLGYFRQMGG